MTKMNRQPKINAEMLNELVLYTVNTSHIYKSSIIPICNNLARKLNKGVFDKSKAIKAFYHVAVFATKEYFREFGGADKWYQLANVDTRTAAAAELLDYYMEYIEEIAETLKNK